MPKEKKRYTKRELNAFRKNIEKEREKLLRDLGFIKDSDFTETIKEASGDHSSYSFHMADMGSDSMDREKAFLFASRDGKYYENLNKALMRIDNGTYGICSMCEGLIGKERLMAVPVAMQCIDCKTKGEIR